MHDGEAPLGPAQCCISKLVSPTIAMSHQGSYNVASFASNTQAEIRRLNAQVDVFWPMEGDALVRNGLTDGMRVMDCGCGPGRLIELLKRRLPNLRCVGVEIDPLLVEACKQHLVQANLNDCTVQQGSAENPGLPPASFDFITMRLVLEHVLDPVAALRSLMALLKPGGRLAVISNDFEFHLRTSPPVPELDPLYEAYCASRRKDGGDPCIGRRVPRLMLQAGFKLVAAEIELAHNAVQGDMPFLKAEGGGIPAQLVNAGFLEASVLDRMTRSWRAMLDSPDHCITRPLWVAVGERLPDGAVQSVDSQRGSEQLPRPQVAPTEIDAQGGTLDKILAIAKRVLERSSLSPDDPLSDVGVDSIAAMMLQERILDVTKVEIPVVRFLSDDSLRKIAEHIDAQGVVSADVQKSDKDPKGFEEGEI
jgi:ubiquinone/menaquinone biosynthesis C-methylase UbiE